MRVDTPSLSPPNLAPRHVQFDERVVVQPALRELFRAQGVTSAEAFLAIPGEIVSGHPDRHVKRVVLDNGRVAYLKREHRIRWKDRFRNWRAGFGWSSKSVREACVLRELEKRGLPGPRWLAYGEDGRGRAFLLVEESNGAVDLRHAWPEVTDPRALAIQIGRLCAELHEAGVDHPDLFSKHFLINSTSHAITLIDWPRARLGPRVSWKRRIHALAALQATVTVSQAEYAAHFLWAYRRVVRGYRRERAPKFSFLAHAIKRQAAKLLGRRGVREQRQPPLDSSAQRLVWLDGEALCAIPEAVPALASPGMAEFLYNPVRHSQLLALAGRTAKLEVGEQRAWLGRCWSWLRRRAWRSPELRKARLLFHLERHHVSAPKLLAYGQQCCRHKARAFLLAESIDGIPLQTALQGADDDERLLLLQQLTEMLSRLHESGCEARTIDCFAVRDDGGFPTIVVANTNRLVFRKWLSRRQKKRDYERVSFGLAACGLALCGFAPSAKPQAAGGTNQ